MLNKISRPKTLIGVAALAATAICTTVALDLPAQKTTSATAAAEPIAATQISATEAPTEEDAQEDASFADELKEAGLTEETDTQASGSQGLVDDEGSTIEAAAASSEAQEAASRTARNCVRSNAAPRFTYTRSRSGNTTRGTLQLVVSIGGCRRVFSEPAGSGLIPIRSTCKRAVSPIPEGYADIDGFYRKTWGNRVVRGRVWKVSNMRCPNGTVRAGLYIHSNGIEGTPWNGVYRTNGCIKLSQESRRRLANAYAQASGKRNATLHVVGY